MKKNTDANELAAGHMIKNLKIGDTCLIKQKEIFQNSNKNIWNTWVIIDIKKYDRDDRLWSGSWSEVKVILFSLETKKTNVVNKSILYSELTYLLRVNRIKILMKDD